MKKIFSLLLAVAASVGTMFAWDYKHVQIGDLYYNLDATNQTAEVTYKSYTNYEYNKGWGITTANIPASVEFYDGVGYSVTSIGEWAFSHCTGLTSVTIPNSVTSIGEDAFFDCTGLTSVTIGNSVTSIGEGAFFSCSGLTSVTIPNSVTSLGKLAFSSCSGLTSVTIGNSVTSIGENAFLSCSGLTSVHISDIAAWCAISFGEYIANPLSYAHNLYLNGELVSDLVIPNSVKSIGSRAFEDCTGLTSVTIPNSVTSIGEDAFYDVPNIVYSGSATGSPWGARSINGYVDGYLVYSDNTKTNLLACSSAATGDITIPNSVTSIGNSAFAYCFGLTSVHISDIAAWCAISFGDDDANPLSYAHNLYLNGELVTDLVIPNSVKSIGDYAFAGCSGLTSVTIPNSVTSIGKGAFFWCDGLTSVTIPNSVTSIGSEAFSECYSLTSVEIPNSVTSIGDGAFSYCTGLTSVTIEAETPPTLGEDAFYNTNKCPIYVPCNAVNAYKTAWSGYANRIVANCSSFTITFVNWDGSNLQTTSVTEGEMPQYTGSTPARPDDEEYTYTFSGWTPAIVAATEDATYTANYTATPKSQGINQITNDKWEMTNKIIRDGNVLILRGDKTYTVMGQEVK